LRLQKKIALISLNASRPHQLHPNHAKEKEKQDETREAIDQATHLEK
jgi:hypothetical protein